MCVDIGERRETVVSIISWRIVKDNQIKIYEKIRLTQFIKEMCEFFYGGLAQLARARHLQCRGHRFDPDILHQNYPAMM